MLAIAEVTCMWEQFRAQQCQGTEIRVFLRMKMTLRKKIGPKELINKHLGGQTHTWHPNRP